MKKNVLMLMIAGLLSGTAIAADSVTFTINGNITPMTCSVSAHGGDTITMQDVAVNEPVTQRVNAILSTNSGTARVSCPLTRGVTVKITQVPGDHNSEGVTTTNTAKNWQSDFFYPTNRGDSGVIFRLFMKKDGIPDNHNDYLVRFGVNRPLHTADTTASHTNLANQDYYLRPAYERLSNNTPVTPGVVSAQIKLDFTYQ